MSNFLWTVIFGIRPISEFRGPINMTNDKSMANPENDSP